MLLKKAGYEQKKTFHSLRHQQRCSFTLNSESFSSAEFKNLTYLKLSNTQLDSQVFENFISRFTNLRNLNLDDNHIEMVKRIPKSIQNFSILHNPLNNCNLDTIMAVINMKSLIESYSGITMQCFGSDMSPEEAFVKVS